MKSGISEYSEALIEGLYNFFDITLLVDNYKIANCSIIDKYKVIQYDNKEDYSNYDYIIYNFGNNSDYHCYMYELINKYRGYVILHDFTLYYLTVGYYEKQDILFQKIYEIEGIDGINAVKDSMKKNKSQNLLYHKELAPILPMNKEIFSMAKGIFVHSQYTKDLIQSECTNVDIFKIHLVNCNLNYNYTKDFLNIKFGIPKNAYIIGSAGFIAETKQNRLVCEAVKRYNEKYDEKIYYVMIGDGAYADDFLDKYIIKTGFFDNADFFNAINSCNLIMNLRYPYQGESSATLIQCMDMEKICVVTDIGWFSEIPDNCVIKLHKRITKEELCLKINLIKNSKLHMLKENAKNYVRDKCSSNMISEKIYKYLKK